MADSENYMQQVNAQYQASRKRRQQRFSSNVINPVDSQGTMDRLQGSDVGGFSGGGSDEGIVPMTIATGGTPATTAGYSGKPGGTPATQAGWLRDTVEGAMGGGQNSGGNCPGGQCGIPRGTTVASMPTTTGPHPEFDDYEGRLKQAYKDGMGARAYGDPSEQGIRTQRSVYDTQSALAERNHHLNWQTQKQDLLNAPVAFAAEKKAADIANAGAEQAQAITHAGTLEGQMDTADKLQELVAFGSMTVADYAWRRAGVDEEEQPREGNSGRPIGMPVDRAAKEAEYTEEGNKIVAFGLWYTKQKASGPMTDAELDSNDAEQAKMVVKLSAVPTGYKGEYEDYITGIVHPQAKETFRSLYSQGIDPKDTAKMSIAIAAADAEANSVRDLALASPPQKRNWQGFFKDNLPTFDRASLFGEPSPVGGLEKDTPQLWGQ